jgi:hypothetical protein
MKNKQLDAESARTLFDAKGEKANVLFKQDVEAVLQRLGLAGLLGLRPCYSECSLEDIKLLATAPEDSSDDTLRSYLHALRDYLTTLVCHIDFNCVPGGGGGDCTYVRDIATTAVIEYRRDCACNSVSDMIFF